MIIITIIRIKLKYTEHLPCARHRNFSIARFYLHSSPVLQHYDYAPILHAEAPRLSDFSQVKPLVCELGMPVGNTSYVRVMCPF